MSQIFCLDNIFYTNSWIELKISQNSPYDLSMASSITSSYLPMSLCHKYFVQITLLSLPSAYVTNIGSRKLLTMDWTKIFRKYFLWSPVPAGGGVRKSPPTTLEKPPLQHIMKSICKLLLDPRDEHQRLIIPP